MYTLFKIPTVSKRVVFLASLGLFCLGQPALPQEINEFRDSYRLKVRTIPVGELRLATRSSDSSYSVSAILFFTGIASLISDVQVRGGTRGWIRSQKLVPYRFHLDVKRGGETETQVLSYKSGRPITFEANPPFEDELNIRSSKYRKTIDPVTMLFLSFRPSPEVKVCGKTYEIFDGAKFVTIALKKPINEKNDVICEGRYELADGFSEKERRRGKDGFKATFRQNIGGNGLFQLHKIEAKTSIGSVVVERSTPRS